MVRGEGDRWTTVVQWDLNEEWLWQNRDSPAKVSLGVSFLCIENECEDRILHTSCEQEWWHFKEKIPISHSHSFQLLSSLLDWYFIAWHMGRSVVSGVSSEVHRNWYFSEASLPIIDQLRLIYPFFFFLFEKWRRVSPVNVPQQSVTKTNAQE